MIRGALVVALMAVSLPARAETVRVAVLVGNNVGSGARRALRYAERDAHRLGEVLSELGGFRPENVHVMAGGTLSDVRDELEQVKARVAAWHAGGQRVVLVFFFSGHSDGQALELGKERWSYAGMRDQLRELGADVRIVIVDSCQSGVLLANKGGTPGPTFDIRFSDDLATAGEAMLTSSAADELALESQEIRGSFFSHHLISGLRGAADSSGDGRVTLAEAYRHAFVNTLLATSGTLNGPQHPGYDYRLSGQGELVLTEVATRGATISLPADFDQILIADEAQRYVVAELTQRSAKRIALPPGRYIVQGRRRGRAYQVRLSLGPVQTRNIALEEFTAGEPLTTSAKGSDLELEDQARPRLLLSAEVGVLRGAADALPWLGSLGLGVRSAGRSGWGAGVELATGRATGFRESSARATLAVFTGRRWQRLQGEAGWRLAGGPLTQTLDAGGSFWGWMAATGPWLGGAVAISDGVLVTLTAGLDGVSMRRDGGQAFLLGPHAGAGVRLRF
jgi:hypothetical protein